MSLERGFAHIPSQPPRIPRPIETPREQTMPGDLEIAARYAKIRVNHPDFSRRQALLATVRALGLPANAHETVKRAVDRNSRTAFGAFSSNRRLGYPYEKDDESE